MDPTVIAGTISTALFAISTMPMLIKAVRTRDLASYSFGNLALSNVANIIHSIYVYSLPLGPIWVLHSFYVVAAAVMLIWYLRFGRRRLAPPGPEPQASEPAHSIFSLGHQVRSCAHAAAGLLRRSIPTTMDTP